jgi:hypothetical protein
MRRHKAAPFLSIPMRIGKPRHREEELHLLPGAKGTAARPFRRRRTQPQGEHARQRRDWRRCQLLCIAASSGVGRERGREGWWGKGRRAAAVVCSPSLAGRRLQGSVSSSRGQQAGEAERGERGKWLGFWVDRPSGRFDPADRRG